MPRVPRKEPEDVELLRQQAKGCGGWKGFRRERNEGGGLGREKSGTRKAEE